MREFPTGILTLLFTDIEGSTRLLQQLGDRYADVLKECRRLLRAAFQQGHGYEVDTQGDAFFVVFERAADAISSAIGLQRALFTTNWPDQARVRVRVGIHTGEPRPAEEGYIGLDVHHAARIMSAAHGGQTLLSQATHDLVADELSEEVMLRDLGEYRLKDIAGLSHLFQLVVPDLPADFPPPATASAQRTFYNVPFPSTSFVGREQEIAAISDLLNEPGVRLLTLFGTGGVGKTRLALQVAREVAPHFAGGVCFVPLDQLSDADGVVPAIAQALELPGGQEGRDAPLIEQVQTVLRDAPFLLILDNFEQVLPARRAIVNLLAGCSQLKVLITSRVLLHMQAEHLFEVPPLPLPDQEALRNLERLSHYPAITLFVQRARAVAAHFRLTTTNAAAVAGICARLDGIPLAIELAAARMRHLSAPAVLAQLEHGLSILHGTMQDAPARQQTLHEAIAWSYQLLEPTEQRVFRRLAVFAGGATLEAAGQVCAEADEAVEQVTEMLAALVDKSMVQHRGQNESDTRYWLLQTLSEYGLERLAEAGELESSRAAHAAFYLPWVERIAPLLSGAEQILWLDRLDQDYENVRAALEWLSGGTPEETARAEQALRLCVALLGYWEIRGYFKEGTTFVERTLLKSRGIAPSVRAQALHGAGFLALLQDDNERAELFLRESQTLFRESGERAGMANILRLQGNLALAKNNYKIARRLLEEALTIYLERGNTQRGALTRSALAQIALAQCDFTRARALLEENLAVYSASGDQDGIAYILYIQSLLLFLSRGDSAEARTLAEQSLARFKAVGNRRFVAYVLNLLGEILLVQGDEESAPVHAMLLESLATFKTVGDRSGAADTLMSLARLEARQGENKAAQAAFAESWELLRAIGAQETAARCLERAGEFAVVQSKPERAVPLWGTAATMRANIVAPMPPVYRASYVAAVAQAREQLGDETFQSLWAQGHQTPWEQVELFSPD
jgi:predicted ATPase/class 3 adenylate cyclase